MYYVKWFKRTRSEDTSANRVSCIQFQIEIDPWLYRWPFAHMFEISSNERNIAQLDVHLKFSKLHLFDWMHRVLFQIRSHN